LETADKEQHVRLLEKEVAFQDQLLHSLKKIRQTNDLLDQSAGLAEQKNILHALAKFEAASKSISDIPVDKSARPMRLLEQKSSELKKTIHDQLSTVWSTLVEIDTQLETITIKDPMTQDSMSIGEAILGLESFKELDNAINELWQNLDNLIIGPRTILQIGRPPLRKFEIKDVSHSTTSLPVDTGVA
jgi:centromere/kinetochore protein ZW10